MPDHYLLTATEAKFVTNKPHTLIIVCDTQRYECLIKISEAKIKRRSNDTQVIESHSLSSDVSINITSTSWMYNVRTKGGKTAGRPPQQYIQMKRMGVYHITSVYDVTGVSLRVGDVIYELPHWTPAEHASRMASLPTSPTSRSRAVMPRSQYLHECKETTPIRRVAESELAYQPRNKKMKVDVAVKEEKVEHVMIPTSSTWIPPSEHTSPVSTTSTPSELVESTSISYGLDFQLASTSQTTDQLWYTVPSSHIHGLLSPHYPQQQPLFSDEVGDVDGCMLDGWKPSESVDDFVGSLFAPLSPHDDMGMEVHDMPNGLEVDVSPQSAASPSPSSSPTSPGISQPPVTRTFSSLSFSSDSDLSLEEQLDQRLDELVESVVGGDMGDVGISLLDQIQTQDIQQTYVFQAQQPVQFQTPPQVQVQAQVPTQFVFGPPLQPVMQPWFSAVPSYQEPIQSQGGMVQMDQQQGNEQMVDTSQQQIQQQNQQQIGSQDLYRTQDSSGSQVQQQQFQQQQQQTLGQSFSPGPSLTPQQQQVQVQVSPGTGQSQSQQQQVQQQVQSSPGIGQISPATGLQHVQVQISPGTGQPQQHVQAQISPGIQQQQQHVQAQASLGTGHQEQQQQVHVQGSPGIGTGIGQQEQQQVQVQGSLGTGQQRQVQVQSSPGIGTAMDMVFQQQLAISPTSSQSEFQSSQAIPILSQISSAGGSPADGLQDGLDISSITQHITHDTSQHVTMEVGVSTSDTSASPSQVHLHDTSQSSQQVSAIGNADVDPATQQFAGSQLQTQQVTTPDASQSQVGNQLGVYVDSSHVVTTTADGAQSRQVTTHDTSTTVAGLQQQVTTHDTSQSQAITQVTTAMSMRRVSMIDTFTSEISIPSVSASHVDVSDGLNVVSQPIPRASAAQRFMSTMLALSILPNILQLGTRDTDTNDREQHHGDQHSRTIAHQHSRTVRSSTVHSDVDAATHPYAADGTHVMMETSQPGYQQLSRIQQQQYSPNDTNVVSFQSQSQFQSSQQAQLQTQDQHIQPQTQVNGGNYQHVHTMVSPALENDAGIVVRTQQQVQDSTQQMVSQRTSQSSQVQDIQQSTQAARMVASQAQDIQQSIRNDSIMSSSSQQQSSQEQRASHDSMVSQSMSQSQAQSPGLAVTALISPLTIVSQHAPIQAQTSVPQQVQAQVQVPGVAGVVSGAVSGAVGAVSGTSEPMLQETASAPKGRTPAMIMLSPLSLSSQVQSQVQAANGLQESIIPGAVSDTVSATSISMLPEVALSAQNQTSSGMMLLSPLSLSSSHVQAQTSISQVQVQHGLLRESIISGAVSGIVSGAAGVVSGTAGVVSAAVSGAVSDAAGVVSTSQVQAQVQVQNGLLPESIISGAVSGVAGAVCGTAGAVSETSIPMFQETASSGRTPAMIMLSPLSLSSPLISQVQAQSGSHVVLSTPIVDVDVVSSVLSSPSLPMLQTDVFQDMVSSSQVSSSSQDQSHSQVTNQLSPFSSDASLLSSSASASLVHTSSIPVQTEQVDISSTSVQQAQISITLQLIELTQAIMLMIFMMITCIVSMMGLKQIKQDQDQVYDTTDIDTQQQSSVKIQSIDIQDEDKHIDIQQLMDGITAIDIRQHESVKTSQHSTYDGSDVDLHVSTPIQTQAQVAIQIQAQVESSIVQQDIFSMMIISMMMICESIITYGRIKQDEHGRTAIDTQHSSIKTLSTHDESDHISCTDVQEHILEQSILFDDLSFVMSHVISSIAMMMTYVISQQSLVSGLDDLYSSCQTHHSSTPSRSAIVSSHTTSSSQMPSTSFTTDIDAICMILSLCVNLSTSLSSASSFNSSQAPSLPSKSTSSFNCSHHLPSCHHHIIVSFPLVAA